MAKNKKEKPCFVGKVTMQLRKLSQRRQTKWSKLSLPWSLIRVYSYSQERKRLWFAAAIIEQLQSQGPSFPQQSYRRLMIEYVARQPWSKFPKVIGMSGVSPYHAERGHGGWSA